MREIFSGLQREILSFLSGPDDSFDALARRLFAFQFGQNLPYRAYCEAIGSSPDRVHGWEQIPAVPAEAFKSDSPLSCLPLEECQRMFLTSGTTEEVRGRHYLADTTLYEASVRHGWAHADLPVGLRPLFLARDPALTPESSLACMFGFLADRADGSPWLIDAGGAIDTALLREAADRGGPVLLFATALALRHLFEELPQPVPLPAGSWVFQTGGYKGVQRSYEPAELYGAIGSQLGVPPERVINEYGMTELSSPSYATGLEVPHRTPPWLRVRTIDPETNRPSVAGDRGHLVFVDLANLNSAVAVRTRDLGTALDPHTFLLAGRDPGATPRGCSRASDSYLQSR